MLFVAVGVLGYGAVIRLVGAFEHAANETKREVEVATELRAVLNEVESAAHDLIDRGPPAVDRFLGADRAVAATLARGSEVLDDERELELLAEIERRWLDEFDEVRAVAESGRADALAADGEGAAEAHFALASTADATTALTEALSDASGSGVDEQLVAARRSARRLTVALGALFGAFAVVTFRFLRHTHHDVLVPLRDLRDTARRYGRGDYEARPASYRAEELSDVARAFDAMADSIDEHRRHLTRQAYTDALTGLPNRSSLTERLESLVRSGAAGGVMYIDLDDFKLVNDGLGHAAGDELLWHVAHRLAAATRRTDLVARLGGDEFAVLLGAPATEVEVRSVAARVVEEIGRPFQIAGRDVRVGASIGIALRRADTNDASILLSEADLAMYEAKARGGSEVVLFEPSRPVTTLPAGAERLRALSERRQPLGRG